MRRPAPHSSATRWIAHPAACCSVTHIFATGYVKASHPSCHPSASHTSSEADILAMKYSSARCQALAPAMVPYILPIHQLAHYSEPGLQEPP